MYEQNLFLSSHHRVFQASTGSSGESRCGAGQGSPGESHLPPESMSPLGPGPPVFLNPSTVTALSFQGAFFCPPPPCRPISLSLLSQKGYEHSLAWKSLTLSRQKEGLVSTLHHSFFHSSRAPPVPTLVLQWSLSRATLSNQTRWLLLGFSLFSATFQGILLVSAYLTATPLPSSATSSSAPCSSPRPSFWLCRFSVHTHLIQSYGFKCLLYADLSKICISSYDLSPSSSLTFPTGDLIL